MNNEILSLAEQWRPVVGHPGYEVSNHGRVRSWLRAGTGNRRRTTPVLRALVKIKRGYLTVMLDRDGGRPIRYVHHLVLEAFRGPRPPGMEARHLDRNPENNRPDNLEWGTSAENKADMMRHGTHTRGSRNGQAKLSREDVEAIRGSTEKLRALADRFGVAESTISLARRGLTYVY